MNILVIYECFRALEGGGVAGHRACNRERGGAWNLPYTEKLWMPPYVYRTVHHLDSWLKRDQLDFTYFIISLFNAQHVSDVNTSIFRSLRLICWVIHGLYCFSLHPDTTPPHLQVGCIPTCCMFCCHTEARNRTDFLHDDFEEICKGLILLHQR